MAFVLSLQLIGFGLAGIMRRFLVSPKSMYWPSILSQVALFVGFHETHREKTQSSKYTLSRYKFFWLTVAIFFTYTWIPQYFVSTTQSVSILCLLSSNDWLRFFGSSSSGRGVGIGALSLDWYFVGGATLTAPFYASLQYAISNIIWSWIVIPILFSQNYFGMDRELGQTNITVATDLKWKSYTLNTPGTFDRHGRPLSPITVMNTTSPSYDLNMTAYDEVRPIQISTQFAGESNNLSLQRTEQTAK
jgi:hypothetical protein